MRYVVLLALSITGCGTYYAYETDETVYGYTDIRQPPVVNEDRGATLTVELFYEALAPYGEWIAHPQLGYVWAPYDAGYVPYTKGHWEYTEHGFTWISDEPFGWAVTHYGRWVVVDDRWLWVPGTEWGPAWVVWREGVEIAGWAPMPPEGWGEPPRESYVFVQYSYLFVTEIHQYYYAGWDAYDAYASTTWVDSSAYLPGGVAYCPGPSVDSLRSRGVAVHVTRPDARRTGRVLARTAADGSVHVRRPSRPVVEVSRPVHRAPIAVTRPSGPRPRVEVRRAPIVISSAREVAIDPAPVEMPPPAHVISPPAPAPVAVRPSVPEPSPVQPPQPSFQERRVIVRPEPQHVPLAQPHQPQVQMHQRARPAPQVHRAPQVQRPPQVHQPAPQVHQRPPQVQQRPPQVQQRPPQVGSPEPSRGRPPRAILRPPRR